MKQKIITGQGADFVHFCFAFDIHSPLFLRIKTDMSKSLGLLLDLSYQEREKKEEEERIRMENIMTGNPLLNTQNNFKVKRR